MGIVQYKKDLSFKLNLDYLVSIISLVKIKDDPVSTLINDYSEIKQILELENYIKALFYNKSKIHQTLYDNDVIIDIKDSNTNDLKTNFYLVLLIRDNIDIINYKYSLNYIKDFIKKTKNEDKKYYNIIKSKIIIDLINNYKNSELYDEEKQDNFLSDLEKENIDCIRKNIGIFNDIDPNLTEDNILEMNIDELYTYIIKYLIKRNKLNDYEYCFVIMEQMDLENIDIPFLESESFFNQILETLDTKNDYIKIYIIDNFEDIQDKNKINFYFILLKYIFKSSIYIYQIPLFLQAHNKIIEFIKTKDFSSITFDSNSMKERFEFIIKKLSDLDYYYSKFINKKESNISTNIKANDTNNIYEVREESDNIIFFKENKTIIMKKNDLKNNNIKEEILKNSVLTFDISKDDDKISLINNINIMYSKTYSITYDELITINIKNNSENNSELNKSFSLFMQFLEDILAKIEEIISDYKIHSVIKITLEFKKNPKNGNLDVIYSIPNEKKSFEDQDILNKGLDQLNELNLFIEEIKSLIDNNQKGTSTKSTFSSSVLTATSTFKASTNNEVKNESNVETFIELDDTIDFQIIKYKKKIDIHKDSVKFFLQLKNGFFFSCGDDKLMVLYDQDLNVLKKIQNIDDTLYHISEKESWNKKYIELIACYLNNIYLIKINLTNKFKHEVRKYEIPKTKITFCQEINDNYILCGINNVLNVKEIFNDNLEAKKMFRLSDNSFKTGCKINDKYIALVSNSLLPGGNNELTIFNIPDCKISFTISEFSPAIAENGIEYIKFKNNNNKFLNYLLCACKNYNSFGQNGFLILDINEDNIEETNYKFYNTYNFEVYCFCQISIKVIYLNNKIKNEGTNFFFVGGLDLDKRMGIVKLFKIQIKDNLEIQYLQDIEDFYGFETPVNTITQGLNSGEIIITTTDGNIFNFSKPNINFYKNK